MGLYGSGQPRNMESNGESRLKGLIMKARGLLLILISSLILFHFVPLDAQLNCSGGPLNCSPPLPISLGGTSGTLGFGTVGVSGAFRLYDSSASGTGSWINFSNNLGILTIQGGNGSASTQSQVQFNAGVFPSANNTQDNGNTSLGWRDTAFNRNLLINGNIGISATAPTVSSGCGSVSTPTFGTGSTAASWSLTMGSTPGTSCVLTLPTASNQWICFAQDISTIADSTSQATPLATNAATFKPLVAWGASDVLVGKCVAH